MNKKGFTLVELLGVILLMGVIATIITVAVDSSIKTSRYNACLTQEKNIIEAAKMYLTDNPGQNTNNKEITIEVLMGANYLENDLKSPMTGEAYSNQTKVIVKNNGGYTYSVSYADPKEKCEK